MMTTMTWNVMVPVMVTMTWTVVVSMIMPMLWTVVAFCAVVMMMVSVVRMMKMSCMGMISVVTLWTVVSSTSAMTSLMVIPVVMMMTKSVMIIILVVIVVFNRGWMRTVMKTLRPRVASLHAAFLSRTSCLVMERVCSSMAMVEGLGMGRLGGVGAPAGLLSSLGVFAGATWVCTSWKTFLLSGLLRSPGWSGRSHRGPLSIGNPKSSEPHGAEHLSGNLIKKGWELHFLLHYICHSFTLLLLLSTFIFITWPVSLLRSGQSLHGFSFAEASIFSRTSCYLFCVFQSTLRRTTMRLSFPLVLLVREPVWTTTLIY